MSTFINALVLRAALVTLLVIITATPASSQTYGSGRVKEGGYVSFTLMPKFTFDGETFDGRTLYQEEDGDEFSVLPKLEETALFKFGLGHRWRRASLDLSYERSQHDGMFADELELDATFQAVNLDARLFFIPDSIIQPYVSVGGSYPWLHIEGSSVLNDQVGDSTYKGWGANAEAGVGIYPHPQFAILAGYSFKALWFDRETGVSDRLFYLRPRFRETSNALAITAAITF